MNRVAASHSRDAPQSVVQTLENTSHAEFGKMRAIFTGAALVQTNG